VNTALSWASRARAPLVPCSSIPASPMSGRPPPWYRSPISSSRRSYRGRPFSWPASASSAGCSVGWGVEYSGNRSANSEMTAHSARRAATGSAWSDGPFQPAWWRHSSDVALTNATAEWWPALSRRAIRHQRGPLPLIS
jgi:hypothetical protein